MKRHLDERLCLLREGTQYDYLCKRHSHCNIITYIIKYILLSKFSPLGCATMSHGTPLCSFKRACQDYLGSTLQSGRWEFRGQENSGITAEVFLLAEPSIGRQEVHSILHCLRHCQTIHQEARPLYSVAYPQSTLGIHLHGLHVSPSFY